MSEIDYRALLRKYVRYVFQVEGSDFVRNGYAGMRGDVEFTPDEWAALKEASDRASADERAGK